MRRNVISRPRNHVSDLDLAFFLACDFRGLPKSISTSRVPIIFTSRVKLIVKIDAVGRIRTHTRQTRWMQSPTPYPPGHRGRLMMRSNFIIDIPSLNYNRPKLKAIFHSLWNSSEIKSSQPGEISDFAKQSEDVDNFCLRFDIRIQNKNHAYAYTHILSFVNSTNFAPPPLRHNKENKISFFFHLKASK